MNLTANRLGRKLLLTAKIAYTAFVVVLVPVYWYHYGPSNFLWFSDIALLVGLIALWWESSFLASMQAVSVVLLEFVWIVDFVAGLFGIAPFGLAQYMFDSSLPLYLRSLSLFHLWMPFALLWMVCRFGYDRRAWIAQTAACWIVLTICYFFTAPEDNINWVFGPGDTPQKQLPAPVYFLLLLILFPICVYLTTHFALKAVSRWMCRR